MKFAENWIIGIDEAGRGPLAGPIILSAFSAPLKLRSKLIKILGGKIKDSKQFSAKRREEIYKELMKLKKEYEVDFKIAYTSAEIIDKNGISYATKIAIRKSLNSLFRNYTLLHDREILYKRENSIIRLDGLLKAPPEFKNQKTIIKGDEKDVFIACASIVAKIRRDRLMCRLGSKYPLYGLEIHKGYGTKLHRKFIKKWGLSEIHRKSFCKSITHP